MLERNRVTKVDGEKKRREWDHEEEILMEREREMK
jgi:hypothetical protein